MKTFLQSHFNELKQQILHIAGIKTITSSDCYRLSLDIVEKTHKRISETTLKRIFGFAMAQYKPSIFTLNTLAEFCGYDSWDAFLAVMEQKQLGNTENMSWLTIKQNANKITRFGLETNKLKSGIPYHLTIQRQAFDAILADFLSSEASAWVISAPAGGGKTICLTHWIDQNVNRSPLSQDIFVLINLFTLTHSTGFGYSGSHWLSFILGMPQKDILDRFIEAYNYSAPGKFYLVIDDMNNALVSDKQFNVILSQLVDMVNHFSKFNWFKIVISLRPSTWQKYKHIIECNENIKKLWFTGFLQEQEKPINLSGFTPQEILKLTSNLNGTNPVTSGCAHEQLSPIRLPLHFQYYFQLKGQKLDPEKINQSDQYEIAGLSLNKDVLSGAYYTEKKILLDKLINFAYYKDNTMCIEKHKGFPIIREFRSAYKELLYSGILYEYKSDLGSRTISEIRFQSVVSATYFLAQRILRRNHNSYDLRLIDTLNKAYYPVAVKEAVLNWFVIFAFESSTLDLLNHFRAVTFTSEHESELILFTCHCLRNLRERSPEVGKKLQAQFASSHFLEYVLDHISIKSGYKSALQDFMAFNLTQHQRILLHSTLGLLALLHMRDDEMALHIEKLRQIETNAFTDFALNPLLHLEALYFYFKHGIIKQDALKEVTRFNFHSVLDEGRIHTQICLLLAYMTSKLSGNPFKTLRFLRALQRYQILNKVPFSKRFLEFIQVSKAYEWLKNGQLKKSTSIQLFSPAITNANTDLQILHAIYQMELAWVKHESLLQEHRKVISICRQHGYRFFEAITRIFFIETHIKPEYQEMVKEHLSALKVLFKHTRYRRKSFLNWTKSNQKAVAVTIERKID